MATSLDKVNFTEPDVELFKIRFPVFVNVDDLRIEFLLDEMTEHVDCRWNAHDYQMAIMYLVAHQLVLEGEPAIANASATTPTTTTSAQEKKRVKVGDVETEFFASGSSETSTASGSDVAALNLDPQDMNDDRLNFNLTHYGRMFIRLRKKNFGGPKVW